MWIEVHDDEELGSSVSCFPLIGTQEAGNVIVLLQEWQAVDGALVYIVLPVG